MCLLKLLFALKRVKRPRKTVQTMLPRTCVVDCCYVFIVRVILCSAQNAERVCESG